MTGSEPVVLEEIVSSLLKYSHFKFDWNEPCDSWEVKCVRYTYTDKLLAGSHRAPLTRPFSERKGIWYKLYFNQNDRIYKCTGIYFSLFDFTLTHLLTYQTPIAGDLLLFRMKKQEIKRDNYFELKILVNEKNKHDTNFKFIVHIHLVLQFALICCYSFISWFLYSITRFTLLDIEAHLVSFFNSDLSSLLFFFNIENMHPELALLVGN